MLSAGKNQRKMFWFLYFSFSCCASRFGWGRCFFFWWNGEDDDKKLNLKTAHTTNKTPLSL